MVWLLGFVPVVFAAASLKPQAHTLLFVLPLSKPNLRASS